MDAQRRAGDDVTLLSGSDFLRCDQDGELTGEAHGYFVGDTRLLSGLAVTFDGRPLHALRHEARARELWVLGVVGDPNAPHALVQKDVVLAEHLQVTLRVENLTAVARRLDVGIDVASDFADIFDVKRGDAPTDGFVGSGLVDGTLRLTYEHEGFHRGTAVRSTPSPSEVRRDGLVLSLDVAARGARTVVFDIVPEPVAGGERTPTRGTLRWRPAAVGLRSSVPALDLSWSRACADLDSLLLCDPDDPDRTMVAAGSPWYMALFGRDSLLTSWQALPLGTGLALGTLAALAARQGTTHDENSDEQPGRIPHEVRSGAAVRRPDGWGEVYYGSVDATPLFVMTLAEAWRWGADEAAVEALLPAAERAMAWCLEDGDLDGDGFIEYPGEPRDRSGLRNQGWKDSDDAVRHPDGALARGPIALVEVQGYLHGALRGLAELRGAFGSGDPRPLLERADRLRAAVDEAFWMEDEHCHALALDGDKAPVRAVTSNAGHLLWTTTALPHRVRPLTARLLQGDVATGFGLRTHSSHHGGFNPLSYHCGSVWPHDSALVAAGMLAAGEVEAGWKLASGLLEVASASGGRLPELFGGFPRHRFEVPVPYPTSCSPQAWAAAVPILLVRALLGIHPDLPHGRVVVERSLPSGVEVELRGMPLGEGHLTLRCVGRSCEVLDAPAGVEVVVAGS